MSAQRLEVLDREECLARLRRRVVGRVAFVGTDGAPIILPVNYRLVETEYSALVALRTRPGAQLDRASMLVAFEVDDVDPLRHEGWSVLVRGTLHHIDAGVPQMRERFDSEPWLNDERESWLVIEPFDVTGRELHARELAWAFDAAAYL